MPQQGTLQIYSDDFQTDKSYDRRTVYQRTHAHMQQELGVDMLDLVLHLTTVLALSMG